MAMWGRVMNLFRRERLSREIEDELAAHVAMRAEDNEAAGMTADEARRDARVRFGSGVALHEATGDADSLPRLESLLSDLRYGWRQMVRYPGFSVVAVAVLAIGIGASLAIFAFVDAVLVRPLPYREPGRLVGVYESSEMGPHYNFSYPDYLDWKRMNRCFAALEGYDTGQLGLKTASGLELVTAGWVSAGFMRMLGVKPVLGRDFRAGEDNQNAANVVLLSYAAWQRRYGGSSGVLGETVVLENTAYQVIGVLPKDFSFAGTGESEFYLPLKAQPTENRAQHWFWTLGRLRDGVDLRSAQAEMSGIAANLARQYPESDGGRGASVESWTEVVVGPVRPVLLLLLVGSILLLGMAAVNVSSLLLVRAEKRRREVAVRGALGASRLRLGRQFVVEGLLLSLLGSGVGFAAAVLVIRLLRISIPVGFLDSMPYLREVGLSWDLAGFAALAAILTGILFAVMPLLRLGGEIAGRGGGLSGEGRTVAGGLWRRMGANLVVVQLMLAVVLLTGAGLLTRSVYKLLHADLGMDAGNLALVHLRLSENATEVEETPAGKLAVLALARQAVEMAQAMPGVESAAISRHLPVNNSVRFNAGFVLVGRPAPKIASENSATHRMVSPNLFSTLKTRLLHGRFFTDDDDPRHPLVVIVNEQFARKYFPGEDAVGKQLQFDPTQPRLTIVGVIENMREGSLDGEIPPAVYQPFAQAPEADFFVVAKVSAETDAEQFAQRLEARLHTLRPDLLTYSAETMEDRMRQTQTAGMHRASAALVGGFAALALVLSAVGLYGVIAYSVSQRTREIGVRMALGAARGDVAGMVMREAGRLAVIGLGLGMVCAVGAAVLMRSLLYGTVPWDVPTLGSVVVVLGLCALVASWLPARRAASVDPMQALRAE